MDISKQELQELEKELNKNLVNQVTQPPLENLMNTFGVVTPRKSYTIALVAIINLSKEALASCQELLGETSKGQKVLEDILNIETSFDQLTLKSLLEAKQEYLRYVTVERYQEKYLKGLKRECKSGVLTLFRPLRGMAFKVPLEPDLSDSIDSNSLEDQVFNYCVENPNEMLQKYIDLVIRRVADAPVPQTQQSQPSSSALNLYYFHKLFEEYLEACFDYLKDEGINRLTIGVTESDLSFLDAQQRENKLAQVKPIYKVEVNTNKVFAGVPMTLGGWLNQLRKGGSSPEANASVSSPPYEYSSLNPTQEEDLRQYVRIGVKPLTSTKVCRNMYLDIVGRRSLSTKDHYMGYVKNLSQTSSYSELLALLVVPQVLLATLKEIKNSDELLNLFSKEYCSTNATSPTKPVKQEYKSISRHLTGANGTIYQKLKELKEVKGLKKEVVDKVEEIEELFEHIAIKSLRGNEAFNKDFKEEQERIEEETKNQHLAEQREIQELERRVVEAEAIAQAIYSEIRPQLEEGLKDQLDSELSIQTGWQTFLM